MGLKNSLLERWTAVRGGPRVVTGMSIRKTKALQVVRDLVDAGQLRAVIDRSYPLEEIVEAHRYVETGRKQGNVVVRVVDGCPSRASQ